MLRRSTTGEPQLQHVRVITLSASYGAGGSLIGPRLAESLGLTFADRLLTTATVDIEDDEGGRTGAGERVTEAEHKEIRRGRIFDRLAVLTGGMGLSPLTSEDVRRPLREQVEASVRALVPEGVVVLGRAGALVLAAEPFAFHVRLDGPPAARLRRGMAIEQIDAATAKRHLEETDKARAAYVDRLYGRRVDDPALYHLSVDATAFGIDDAVRLLSDAAEVFWARQAARLTKAE
jgi:cytidylate kinase